MAAVSVPEKTLEHWCSQYITYRYRSNAGLWWPTTGADIDVRFLPRTPGKAFQLELKTTYFGATYHDVWIDLGQLLSYWNRRRAAQPFYAFPWPDWSGELEPVAVRHRVEPTSLAFSRSGPGWWFADWMVVLTIDDMMNVLRPEVLAHRAAHAAAGTSEETRGTKARLVRYRAPKSGGFGVPWVPTWGSGSRPKPTVIKWRDFWDRLQRCGLPGWPQLVQLPRTYLLGDDSVSHAQVRQMLLRAKAASDTDFGELVWLQASTHGEFEVFSPADPQPQLGPRELPDERPGVANSPDDDLEARTIRDPDDDLPPSENPPSSRPQGDDDDAGLKDLRQFTFLGARWMK